MLSCFRSGAIEFIAWLDVAYLISVFPQIFGRSVALGKSNLATPNECHAYKPIVSFVFDIGCEIAGTNSAVLRRRMNIGIPHRPFVAQANPAFAMLATTNDDEMIQVGLGAEKGPKRRPKVILLSYWITHSSTANALNLRNIA